MLDKDGYHEWYIEYDAEPYGEKLKEIKQRIEACKFLVGFNIKFDLQWIKRYLPNVHFPDVYDCQLADFILHSQKYPFASLNEVLARLGLGTKLDVVHDEYWANGIDTTSVPKDVLSAYCKQDILLTNNLFEWQLPRLGTKKRAFWMDCKDLLVLRELEEHGMMYDIARATDLGRKTESDLLGLDESLKRLVPCEHSINFASPAQLSAILYGGTIDFKVREATERVLKDGTVKHGERWGTTTVEFPRLVDPYSDDDLSVAEPVLKRLKPRGTAKKIIGTVLERARLQKLDSTYYRGLVDKYQEMEWTGDCLHGNFNQCAVITSRLSSSAPNLQNFSEEIKELFYSRYVKEQGVLVNADWKGLEWYAAVLLSGDLEGRREIIAGVDQHSENQRWLGFGGAANGRLLAKKFVFRLIYGGSAYAYANDPEFSSLRLDEKGWQRVIDLFYEKYRGLKEWHDSLVEEVMRYGMLTIPTGRTFEFEPMVRRGKSVWPRTTIINYPVQAFGAELMKVARLLYFQKLKRANLKHGILISTVHDSLLTDTVITEVPEVSRMLWETWEEVNPEFERIYGFKIDLPARVEVSYGPNWKDQKEIQRGEVLLG